MAAYHVFTVYRTRLTWHPVNCFEWPQHPHCSDGREVDILQVQRVLDHPGKWEKKSIQIKHTLKIHTTTFPKQLQFYSCKTNRKKTPPKSL